MTVEELYYRLGSLVRNGYGTCKINMIKRGGHYELGVI